MNAPTVHSERGFGIVEVLVALTIIIFCTLSVAAGTAAVARMSGGSAGSVQRTAAMTDFVGYLSTMPWRDLPDAGETCEDVTGSFPHERCVTVEDLSQVRKRLTAVVDPDNPRVSPDTLSVERGRPLGANPLNAP